MAGFCAQAAVRRTPLLLDGMAVTAAALVAERMAPGARQWWRAGHRSTEPGHEVALAALELDPILDLRMRLGEGTGATVALPVLRGAVAALSSMATFSEAGVAGPSSPPPRLAQ
jgi:nicotinate-nucleotide--dimethylbenzimidazole phosphoribosyltransferase